MDLAVFAAAGKARSAEMVIRRIERDRDRVGAHAGKRDMHLQRVAGLDDVDRRLPRHLGVGEELALQALCPVEHRQGFAPHPAEKSRDLTALRLRRIPAGSSGVFSLLQ